MHGAIWYQNVVNISRHVSSSSLLISCPGCIWLLLPSVSFLRYTLVAVFMFVQKYLIIAFAISCARLVVLVFACDF
jgi:hypothetical protein